MLQCLEENGARKIRTILTERGRKNSSGQVSWAESYIVRVIKNATYTGTICYNKSRSNNFLEQKRVNNLDMSTYQYLKEKFPAIISQETWNRAQKIREERIRPELIAAAQPRIGKKVSKDTWTKLLRCSCGASFRKNKWHVKNNGSISYGYECYGRINHGSKKKKIELGLAVRKECDMRMICDWKLEFMACELFKHVWGDKKEAILTAMEWIKKYYKMECAVSDSGIYGAEIKLEKTNQKLNNLIEMRADGEISREEYLVAREKLDKEIEKLRIEIQNKPENKVQEIDLEAVRECLNNLIDFNSGAIEHAIIEQVVCRIVPVSDTMFEWYIGLEDAAKAKARLSVEGRKTNAVVTLEEIMEISSLHRQLGEGKKSSPGTLLHRQQLRINNKKSKIEM